MMKINKVICMVLVMSAAQLSGQELQSSQSSSSAPMYLFTIPSHGLLGDSLAKKAIKAGVGGQIKQATDVINSAIASDVALYFSCKEPLTGLAIEKAVEKNAMEINSKLKLYMLSEADCSAELKNSLERYGVQKRQ
jgi:hypothetical protein